MRHISIKCFVSLALPLALLTGCVSFPSPGEKFVMVIKKIPSVRQDLEDYPGLALALRKGVTRADISSGRLVRSGCYFEAPKKGESGLRFGFSLLPDGKKAVHGETIIISAEEADGREGPYARFFGRYVGEFHASEADFFKHRYVNGDAFRCRPISSSGLMEVEVISEVASWDYALAEAELSRNSQITDDELQSGLIAMGECSPGVDSWALWNVRIPAELKIKVGDYIEATVGSTNRSTSTGPISIALRKVAKPAKDEFIRTQGSDTISCSAHAESAR